MMIFKKIIKHAVYYISVSIVFGFYLWLVSALIPDNASLGFVMGALYLFLASMPILTAVLMRFSPLPWVIDPFAAAELPLCMLASMLLTLYNRTGDLSRAFISLRIDLSDDGGMGYIVFAAWFVFALICTISLKRPKGDGLTDRIFKFFTEEKKEGKAE